MKSDRCDYETRKNRRLEKLGTNEPRCGSCGENRWQTLEEHHVAGAAHGDDTVILCRNCHRVASDQQLDHPPTPPGSDPALSAIGHFLLGLADLLGSVVETLAAFGRSLLDMATNSTCKTGEV
jgi:hypothetical protein